MNTGIKALTKGEQSPAYYERLERVLAIVRTRYERWLRVKYRELFKRTRARLLALESPTEAEVMAVGIQLSEERRKLLERYLETIYPLFSAFIEEDQDKGAPFRLEIKAKLSLSLLAWIQETVGHYIRVIDGNVPPLDEVRLMAWQANGDPAVFKELMDKSSIWSTTGCAIRSRRVAVTETTIMLNASMAKASESLAMGRKRVKTWHTSHMRNVRDAHAAVDGVTINSEDYFELRDTYGGVAYLKYPGDNSMHPDPALVVNCRCYCTYSYVEE